MNNVVKLFVKLISFECCFYILRCLMKIVFFKYRHSQVVTMSNFYLNFAKTRACAMVSSPNAGKSTIPERLLLWGATQPAVVALERHIGLDEHRKRTWYFDHHIVEDELIIAPLKEIDERCGKNCLLSLFTLKWYLYIFTMFGKIVFFNTVIHR